MVSLDTAADPVADWVVMLILKALFIAMGILLVYAWLNRTRPKPKPTHKEDKE